MFKSISNILKKAFTITDILAGVCFFSVMALVLANVIMRNIFKQPIMGTVEIVGLLIASGLGFGMANCEMNDGNIGLDMEMKWLSERAHKILETVTLLVSLSFWVVVVWRMFIYANTSLVNGRITSTASIPIFPFIFILGINMFCLCVALLYKFVRNVRELVGKSLLSEDTSKDESKEVTE